MYRFKSSINPQRLSTFGILFFLVLVLLSSLLGFFFGGEETLFSAMISEKNFLVPIYILLMVFLLNRWLGYLILLDTEGRSAFRLFFPVLIFVFSFLSFTPQIFIEGKPFFSSAIEFILINLSSILFIAFLLQTRGDERSPSLMLALALLLGGLSIFMPKLLIFTPIVFYLLYELKSLSWRNFFAFLWGIILIPLFLFPFLWYRYEGSVSELFYNWLRPITQFNFCLDLNLLSFATIFLFSLIGQVSYSISVLKPSIAQRGYLTSLNALMWLSFVYILFFDNANTFVLSLLILCSTLSLSRAVVSLNKIIYYVFLFVFSLLMLANIFFLNYY